MKAVLMLSNCDSEENAERIAHALLARKLAAAVQIIGPARSFYRWQGELHKKEEWLMVIKTSAGCESRIREIIGKLHNYALPGVMTINIDGGESAYLQWLLSSCHDSA